jgi:hypothetical protein
VYRTQLGNQYQCVSIKLAYSSSSSTKNWIELSYASGCHSWSYIQGGLEILVKLEEQQIIKHFSAFQGHLRRNDNIALSLRIQLLTQQLEVGSGKLFLNTNPSKYPYATHNT